ncbi:MAG: hypothetical protein HETSPECPRED_003220 [Heterodermia speciosa]|uniref:Uncharacterized protein n=1 Tax=Heterodermia speciosa TaxID=116794 RepID=A0A8H3PHH4_9LECA|nr:MAG: hypothetical protein HETSPECPRED_003220 [Heterodermia speciosa]
MRPKALESKKRSFADIDDGVGLAKKQRIETTPTMLKEGEVRSLLPSLLIVNQSFIAATNFTLQEARPVIVTAKDKVDIDSATAQLEAETGENVKELKEERGTAEDLTAKNNNRPSGSTLNEKDNTKVRDGIQEDGLKVVEDSNNPTAQTIQAVAAGGQAESGVIRAGDNGAQAHPSRSHRQHRPTRPLRQYPGPRTGHFYKPHAVVLLDGTCHIVWYPK